MDSSLYDFRYSEHLFLGPSIYCVALNFIVVISCLLVFFHMCNRCNYIVYIYILGIVWALPSALIGALIMYLSFLGDPKYQGNKGKYQSNELWERKLTKLTAWLSFLQGCIKFPSPQKMEEREGNGRRREKEENARGKGEKEEGREIGSEREGI